MSLLLATSGLAVTPVVILAAVTAFVAAELIDPPRRASSTP